MRRLWTALAIACLAAGPVLASPQSALAAAVADAERLPDAVACRTLYLSLDNIPEAERPEMVRVLDGWVHHLSRLPDIARTRPVPGGEVVAVNIDDYGWSDKTREAMREEVAYHRWEKRGDGYLYSVPPRRINPTLLADLKRLTHSGAPIVRADFFLFYSSRQLDLRNRDDHGFGYLDWLQLRNQADVEKLAGLDRKKSIQLGKELRALIEQGKSGVVQLDREIQWFASYGDGEFGVWITLDVFDNGNGNTAPGNLKAGTLRHNAEEWVFGLPSGMVGMWLSNQKGVKQNTAPDQLGGNDSPHRVGRDTRIHVGRCGECHTDGGLKDADDWARRTLRSPNQLDDTDYQEFLRLKRQLFGNLNGQIARGRARYAAALHDACGMTTAEFEKAKAKAVYRYQYGTRDPQQMAVELGTTEAQLRKSLRAAFDKGNRKMIVAERQRLTPLLTLIAREPGSLPVTYFEQFYQDLQGIVEEYP